MIKSVAIVVLNWNNARDTISCLDSLAKLDYPDPWVIVVDNGSSDDSVVQIRAAHPSVTLIETGANLDYTGGNNAGIRHALAGGADFVFLLNNDAIVAPDALSRLVQAAQAWPNAGFLGPMVRTREQPNRILSAGGVFWPDMTPGQRGLGELDQGQYGEVEEVDFLSGCALLVSRAALEAVGLLDERYFAYGEDVEWCFRGRRAGFKVLFAPQGVVWHPDTSLRDQNSSRVVYYITRNHLLFLRQHHLGLGVLLRTLLRNLIWLVNWSVNPKWRHIKSKRDALWWALRDFALGRFGKSRDL
jgi:hypothetical protein